MTAARPPLVIAHRGASAERAEHTLGAYELALAQGADGVECDVRLTRDGHLVCIHDATLDRTAGSPGRVSAMTLEELRTHDFGAWKGEVSRGASILEFAILLDLLADHPGRALFVETKHPVRTAGAVERELARVLTERGFVDRSVMMSFSVGAVRRTRRLVPALRTVMLREPHHVFHDSAVGLVGATMAGPSIRAVRRRPERVSGWTRRGFGAFCWTVDAPEDVALCRDLGLTAIGTNRPARTLNLLHASE